jgi:hypothetical protein
MKDPLTILGQGYHKSPLYSREYYPAKRKIWSKYFTPKYKKNKTRHTYFFIGTHALPKRLIIKIYHRAHREHREKSDMLQIP